MSVRVRRGPGSRSVALILLLLLPVLAAATAVGEPRVGPSYTAPVAAGPSNQWAVRGPSFQTWAEAERAMPGDLSISPDGQPAIWILLKVGSSGPRPVITNTVATADLLQTLGIRLRGNDRVRPASPTLTPGMHLTVVRLRTVVETVSEPLPYQTATTFTPDLAPGETRVITPGRAGTALRTYRVTYRNGVEIRRILLGEETLVDPIDAVILQGPAPDGSHGAQTGQASWYYCPTEGNFAAHLTIPKGTSVTVTNTDTGATVTVVINDRGPYGVAGRIIDLCSTAFAQIAPLGQGVANVSISW